MSNLSENGNRKQDCPNKRECFEMLQLILDGEASPRQKEIFLQEHLEECMPCYRNYHLEVAIRQLLRTKCTHNAPQDLVEEIKRKVAQNLVR
ncbi:MAG: zf-HC2 domain-containing protein [Chryseosolibacter sp.]